MRNIGKSRFSYGNKHKLNAVILVNEVIKTRKSELEAKQIAIYASAENIIVKQF